MAAEERPESHELKGVVRAIQLTAIDSLEVDGSKVYGTGGGDEAGVELSRLADRCGVHEAAYGDVLAPTAMRTWCRMIAPYKGV